MAHFVPSLSGNHTCEGIQTLFKWHHTEMLVVTEDEIPLGVLTLKYVSEKMASRFGYACSKSGR